MEDQDPPMVISKIPRTKRVGQSQELSPAAVEDDNGVEEPEENYETDTAGTGAAVIKATTTTGVTAETQQEQHKKKKKKKKKKEEEEKGFEFRRFRLKLSADEIVSDLMKMHSTGKRVKKRSRKKQDCLDDLFPGGCLSKINEKSYDTFSDRF